MQAEEERPMNRHERRRAHAKLRATSGTKVDPDRVVMIRQVGGRTQIVHTPRRVHGRVVTAVENFITSYDGDHLLHDIELEFPDLTYRDFFVAFSRFQAAEDMLRGGRR
jgi:hypothetical protein